ncbi:dihydroxyacetone kinase subunit DhaL [Bacillus sp. 1P10SD]|uniref:dihydroxyacetone kinase subunit DhaL n=1 Tax=Bacillus sp. 1P10SD TaxID=3132265 RepID=UPI0039A5EEC7
MRNTLQSDDIMGILSSIKDLMEENKDYLCELDAALGDGDIGLTVSKGFKAIAEEVAPLEISDMGLLFKKSGFVLAEAVPSTIGTILASAFMQAGNGLKGKNALETADLATLFEGMIEGIRKRGKASFGDKTILDSLYPALEALKEASKNGLSLQESIRLAYVEAQNGAERTKEMQSRHGRAVRYFENSIGHQDPGATVGALIIKGFNVYLNK